MVNRKFTNHGCIPNKHEPPCKDCPNRKVGCHGVCGRYMAWTLEEKEYKEEIRKKENPKYYAGRKKA